MRVKTRSLSELAEFMAFMHVYDAVQLNLPRAFIHRFRASVPMISLLSAQSLNFGITGRERRAGAFEDPPSRTPRGIDDWK